jgi:heme/copper-type cytochrome/quinol oxidase subunit 1
MVRAALLHLGIGFTIGALMLYNKGNPINPSIWRLLAAHMDFVLLGWTMQLAMGVAFWIMPRFSGEQKYGSQRLAWVALILINVGIFTVALSPCGDTAADVMVLAGRMAELLAAIAFVIHIWPRVKAFGVQIAKKE